MARACPRCRLFDDGAALLVAASFSLLWTVAQAGAQPSSARSESVTLDTLEVTARRTAEPLANVPVSVGVATPADIAFEAPSNAAIDISRRIPNYSVTDVGNPLFAFGAIRGVGTLSFPQNPFDSTIGYALNGTPLSLYAGTQQLLDVQRVEVLRGPQNVLFGRSSEGGTVNIVPTEADGVRDLRIRSEFGTRGNFFTDLIAGGTIIPDVLNGRAAIRFTGGGGDVKNILNGQNLPDREIAAARGALRWYLGDATTVTVTGFYERDRRDTFNYILRDGPSYPAVALDQPLKFARSLAIGTAEIKHRFDAFDLTATFGVQDINSRLSSDNTDGLIYNQLTGFPVSAFASSTCADCTRYLFRERAYSGEIRASAKPDDPVRWTTGLNIYKSNFEHSGTNTSSFGPTQNGYYDAKLDLDSYSGFAEVGVPIADQWTLTPGIRIGHDTVSRRGTYISNGVAGTVPSFAEYGQVGDTFVAGGLTLGYKPDESSLIYTSAKRGYSNAGFPYFNIFAPFRKPAPSYPASYAWTYEGGARTTILDGRVSLEGSVFYNDVQNGHVNAFDMRANTFTIATLDYRTYGFEAGARVRLTDGLTSYANVGLTRAAFVNVPATDTTGARDGGRLPGIPSWSGVVGLESRIPLGPAGSRGDLVSSAELQFVAGRRAADIANTFDLRPYRIVNARIGWENETYKIYAFARNLFDENIELAGASYTPTVLSVTPGLRRVIGGGAEVRF
jgi:iron complex outermembrane receptor protein